MAYFRKVKAGLVTQPIEDFVGEQGNIFFNVETGELRLSDGVTPGGQPIMLVGGGNYTLLPATANTLAGIKVGSTLTVAPDGTLNASSNRFIDDGYFTLEGDARAATYVLRNQTTGTAVTELFLDGVSQRLIVEPNSVWTYAVTVSAKSMDGVDAAAFRIEGAIARNTPPSSVFMVGNNISVTVIGRTDDRWDAYTDFNISQGALTVKVKGVMGKTIRWIAKVETTEIKFL